MLENIRSELGSIFYESNILGTKGPRKMIVILPETKGDSYYEIKPKQSSEGIIKRY